jgi:tetratricopeptide (TPR) repeat protein
MEQNTMTVESTPKPVGKLIQESKTNPQPLPSPTPTSPTAWEPPTHYEYAVLSALVYRPAEEQGETPQEFKVRVKDSDGYFRLHKWQELQGKGWFLFEKKLKKGKEGFTAGIYINKKTHQIIIAFRGTVTDTENFWETLGTLKTDQEGIAKGELTAQREEMALFIYEARDELEKAGYNTQPDSTFQHYQLSFTGHSLGAWLAEQAAYQFECPAVTFDSPGTWPALKRWNPRGLTKQLDVTTYFSKPNLINTCNKHHPWTRRELTMSIPPRDHWIKTWLAYTLDQHSIENIINAFNPETGSPNAYREVVLWPTCGAELYQQIERQFNKSFVPKIKEAFLDSLTTGGSWSEIFWNIGLGAGTALINLLSASYQAKAETEYNKYLKYIERLEKQKVPGEPKLEGLRTEFYLHYYAGYSTQPANDKRLDIRHFHPEISHWLQELRLKPLAASKTHLSHTELSLIHAYEYRYDPINQTYFISVTVNNLSVDIFRRQVTSLLAREYTKMIKGETSLITLLRAATPPGKVKQDTKISAPLHRIFNLSQLHNPHFTGRKEALSALQQGFKINQSRPQCIIGGPGIGKTQLAIAFAHQHAADYDVTYWLSANNLLEEYRTLLKQLLKSEYHPSINDLPLTETCNRVSRALARYTRVLLIVDDIDSPDIRDFLPSVNPTETQLHILMTTRNSHCKYFFTTLTLDEHFTPAEAKQFIHHILPAETPQQADQLAMRLHYHPLALAQAIGYIHYYHHSITQYLKLLSDNPVKILEEKRPDDRYANNVYATLHLSVEKIQRESPLAVELLYVMAYLSPEAILMSSLAVATKQNVESIQKAVPILEKQALVSESALPEAVRIHPLLQEILRLEQARKERQNPSKKSLLENIITAFAYALREEKDLRILKQHMTHVHHLARHLNNIESPTIATHLFSLGALASQQGDLPTAKCYHQQALAIRRKALGEEHPHVAASLNNLGTVTAEQGDLPTAKRYFEQALAIERKALGEEHSDVAASLNNLGIVARMQGDLTTAKRYYEQALAIRRKAVGEEHPHVAASLTGLGVVAAEQGDLPTAKRYHEQALAIRRKALGEEHPDVAASLNNLGIVARSQGDLPTAKRHHEQALAIRRKVLGEEHPHVAASLTDLGTVVAEQGDLATAKRYFEQALAIERKTLGEEHPDVAASLNNLGIVARRQGDLPTAKRYYEQALPICRKTLGEEHPHVAASLTGLGVVAAEQGDLPTAKRYHEQALVIRRKALGEEHPHVAASLNNLGIVARRQGDLTTAKRDQSAGFFDKPKVPTKKAENKTLSAENTQNTPSPLPLRSSL